MLAKKNLNLYTQTHTIIIIQTSMFSVLGENLKEKQQKR